MGDALGCVLKDIAGDRWESPLVGQSLEHPAVMQPSRRAVAPLPNGCSQRGGILCRSRLADDAVDLAFVAHHKKASPASGLLREMRRVAEGCLQAMLLLGSAIRHQDRRHGSRLRRALDELSIYANIDS